ncbi:MAG: ABC transporter permease [Bacilli bacterium]|nr:ABC transporter permease [Bacilli bacterium]MBP5550531.1 ABC transporter permease [Bacilli bacterium]
MIISFIVAAISMGVVYLYGCIGETIIEKGGNLNLGIPGIMCLGALGGAVGVNVYFAIFSTANVSTLLILPVAIFFSFLFASLGGLVYAVLTVSLQANQNVTGLALTTFGVGMMKFLGSNMNHDNFTLASKAIKKLFVNYEVLGGFGRLFLSYGFLVYLAFLLAIGVGLFIKYTRVGLFLRAIGESPKTADAQGVNVTKYKYLAILIGSGIAGLGGLYYVMDRSGGTTFVEAAIEAFGWLSVALVIFSMWKPWVGALGSILFGGLYVLPQYVGISNIQIKLFDLFPYVVTVLVLIITSILDAKNSQPPAALGVNYYREDR